jgi:hypothetical protein
MDRYRVLAPVQCPRCHVPSGLNCWWGICNACHERIWMMNLRKDLIPPNIRIGGIQVEIVSCLIVSDKTRYLSMYYDHVLRPYPPFSQLTYFSNGLAGNCLRHKPVVNKTTDIFDKVLEFLIGQHSNLVLQ